MSILNSIKSRIERERPANSLLWRPLFFMKDTASTFLTILKGKRYGCIMFNKGVWFNMPKVAGTSICLSLGKDIDCDLDQIKEKNLSKIKKDFKFAFVRNPYDRVVSCYLNQIKKPNRDKNFYLEGMYNGFWRFGGKFDPEMSFDEFVKAVSSIPDKKANPHFRSQYTFISNKKGKIFVDFIGRFENLEKDYKKICQKAGLRTLPRLPKQNKTKKRKDYHAYYNSETKKMIALRYAKDLKYFNYSF